MRIEWILSAVVCLALWAILIERAPRPARL